jgi:hypothetical protein
LKQASLIQYRGNHGKQEMLSEPIGRVRYSANNMGE